MFTLEQISVYVDHFLQWLAARLVVKQADGWVLPPEILPDTIIHWGSEKLLKHILILADSLYLTGYGPWCFYKYSSDSDAISLRTIL